MAGYPWGGSEELWSRTALDLRAQGLAVAASVLEWRPTHPRVRQLHERGIEVIQRPRFYSRLRRVGHKLTACRSPLQLVDLERLIAERGPQLIVISAGGAFPPIDIIELCAATQYPFVTISQANDHSFWPDDNVAPRYRKAFRSALRCYFVSKANLRLAEKQIGTTLPNAEVVWNPFNVDPKLVPPWPSPRSEREVRLACVGRLDPPSKGQDILFEALADGEWRDRRWRLYLYGEGPMREGLALLAERLGLSTRVQFEGYRAIEHVWASNHVLVMPSRYEGLPLAIVEAMLCGRPVVATDIGGNAEVVEDGVTGFLADAPKVGSVAGALERFWSRRDQAEEIGRNGAQRIRQLVPANPAHVFAEKLKQLIS
jgi:glycosyltransferase involved in cell wall biosynthesis